MLQSRRLAAVQTPVIPIVGRWTAETPGTISLGQGIVVVRPAARSDRGRATFGGALDDHRYGPVEGLPALVEALEDKLARENGIRVRPGEPLVVTAGGNLAFMNASLAITDPGDEVIFPAPFYFNHEMAVMMAGARPVPVPTTRDYQLDLDAIARAITPRTRAVVTVSPNNPTGAVYPEESLRAVNALCRERGIFHIHDEAYEYFTYGDAPHFSPGSIDGAAAHTISLFSLSKAYGMASWRVGYMVIPGVAVGRGQQDSGHAADLRAGRLAGRGGGGARRRPRVRDVDSSRRSTRCGSRSASALDDPAVPCDVAPAPGAFYFFVRVYAPLDSLDAHRAADPRASGRRRSRLGVRRRRVLASRLVRRARSVVGRRKASRRLVARTPGAGSHVKSSPGTSTASARGSTSCRRSSRPSSRTSSAFRRSRRRPTRCPALLVRRERLLVLLARRRRLLGRRAARPPQFFHGTAGVQSSVLRSRAAHRRRRPRAMSRRVGLRAERRQGLRREAAVPRGAGRPGPLKRRRPGRTLLVCGDLNVAREERDVHPKERKPNQIGTRPEERALLERAARRRAWSMSAGRSIPDNNELFTWWAPWRNLRQRNIGWRIDYVLASRTARGDARRARSRCASSARAITRRSWQHSPDHGSVMSLRLRLILAFFLLSVVPLGALDVLRLHEQRPSAARGRRTRGRAAGRRAVAAHAGRDGAAERAGRAPDGACRVECGRHRSGSTRRRAES